MATDDKALIAQCEIAWEGEYVRGVLNKNNCSGFLKAVGRAMGYPIPNGVADDIVAAMASGWKKLADGAEAAQRAAAGSFVVVGLKSTDRSPPRNQGHVAIVVGGPLYRGKYPMVWGGSTGTAQSRGNKSAGEV